MSRIGKSPIPLPAGAKVSVKDGVVEVAGPKGSLREQTLPGMEIKIDGEVVTVERKDESGPTRARHGLMRSLIANAVTGVTEGFKKELQVVGVGYRGEVQGRDLQLSLGFSHPVVFPMPKGIDIEIDKQNKITVSGADKQAVGQVAAELRSLRKPDPYKGKGIRYVGERVRMKEGKASGK